MSWWVANEYAVGGAALVASHIFWVILSIILHELAHGWAALWQGDDTPRRLNRMHFDPLVHMGAMSLLTFALIGLAWGMMPTNPSRYRWRRRGHIVVAGAGPVMNVLLALVACAGLAIVTHTTFNSPDLERNLRWFFYIGATLNFVLAFLNLLPVPPLDGSRILSGIWFKWWQWMQDPRIAQVSTIILLIIFFSSLGDVFWHAADACVRAIVPGLGPNSG